MVIPWLCLCQGHSVTACFRVRKDSNVTNPLLYLLEGLERLVHYCACFGVRQDFSPLLCSFQVWQDFSPLLCSFQVRQDFSPLLCSFQVRQDFSPLLCSFQVWQDFSPLLCSFQVRQDFSPLLCSFQVWQNFSPLLCSVHYCVHFRSGKTPVHYHACFRVRKDLSVPASSSKHVDAASGINSTGWGICEHSIHHHPDPYQRASWPGHGKHHSTVDIHVVNVTVLLTSMLL